MIVVPQVPTILGNLEFFGLQEAVSSVSMDRPCWNKLLIFIFLSEYPWILVLS